MFRDLKEYQEIQKIYEESISQYLTEEEEDIVIEYIKEQKWTAEQIDELIDALENGESLSEGSGAAAGIKAIQGLFKGAKNFKGLTKLKNFRKGFDRTVFTNVKPKPGSFPSQI